MMKNRTYWHKNDNSAPNSAVDAFIDDVIDVCKKHGMSIAHEDNHGAFIIEDYSDINIEWLENADVDIDGKAP